MKRSRTREAGLPDPADNPYWRVVSGWWEPTESSEDFGTTIDVSPAAIRQYRSRDLQFPVPAATDDGARWSQAQIYQWIQAARPKMRYRVPRIFHDGHDLMPATFLAAETAVVQLQGRHVDCAIHLWQPADDRGPVAMVYAVLHTSDTMKCAKELLSRAPRVSAVAVVTPEVRHLPCPPGEEGFLFQPELAVAERHHRDGAEAITTEYRGWFQLAALLRADLPWWPPTLRRPDAVVAWRPGAAPQAIRPYAPDWYDAAILYGLLDAAADPDDAEQYRGIADRLNRRIEGEIHQPPPPGIGVPEDAVRPGLMQVARPDYLMPDTPPPPTRYDVLGLLNLEVPNRQARTLARQLLSRRREIEAVISQTIHVGPGPGELGAEWLNRLTPCDDPRTLGASFAEANLTDNGDPQPRTWWRDPENSNCWAVETIDGTYHVTVGSQLPEAGRLVAFELAADCWSAFFRDHRGIVWPMPVTAFGGYYNAGYRGTGPDELAKTVTRLHRNAGVDLADRIDETVPAALSRLVHARDAPLAVSEGELDALMAESQSDSPGQ